MTKTGRICNDISSSLFFNFLFHSGLVVRGREGPVDIEILNIYNTVKDTLQSMVSFSRINGSNLLNTTNEEAFE